MEYIGSLYITKNRKFIATMTDIISYWSLDKKNNNNNKNDRKYHRILPTLRLGDIKEGTIPEAAIRLKTDVSNIFSYLQGFLVVSWISRIVEYMNVCIHIICVFALVKI